MRLDVAPAEWAREMFPQPEGERLEDLPDPMVHHWLSTISRAANAARYIMAHLLGGNQQRAGCLKLDGGDMFREIEGERVDQTPHLGATPCGVITCYNVGSSIMHYSVAKTPHRRVLVVICPIELAPHARRCVSHHRIVRVEGVPIARPRTIGLERRQRGGVVWPMAAGHPSRRGL